MSFSLLIVISGTDYASQDYNNSNILNNVYPKKLTRNETISKSETKVNSTRYRLEAYKF